MSCNILMLGALLFGAGIGIGFGVLICEARKKRELKECGHE